MKKVYALLIMALLLAGGCSRNKQLNNKDEAFIIVDVEKDYTKKELKLQDFMNVEYIALESSDEFLCQGRIFDIGKNIMLVGNEIQDGNIFVFDRNGKGIRKINRRGSGGEEYVFFTGVCLDEENNEIFVNDVIGGKIVVYDLYGKFKRSFSCKENIRVDNIYNFNNEKLICELGHDRETTDRIRFAIVSKQDGTVIDKIRMPYEQKKTTKITTNNNLFMFYPYHPLLPYNNNWILSEASSDTVFSLLPNGEISPFIARTPSIQSMEPEVFLFPKMFTERFCFMEKVKKEQKFSKVDLVYDRQDEVIYEYSLYNDDYVGKQYISLVAWETKKNEVGLWQKIEADELVKAYKEGELKGRLKVLAAKLEEGANPIVMLIKEKKVR